MRILENTTLRLPEHLSRKSYIISGILLTVAIISLVYPGLEAGIDFKGGTEFIVGTGEAVPSTEVASALGSATGEIFEVKEFGDPQTLLVRTAAGGDADALAGVGRETASSSAFPQGQPGPSRAPTPVGAAHRVGPEGEGHRAGARARCS